MCGRPEVSASFPQAESGRGGGSVRRVTNSGMHTRVRAAVSSRGRPSSTWMLFEWSCGLIHSVVSIRSHDSGCSYKARRALLAS